MYIAQLIINLHISIRFSIQYNAQRQNATLPFPPPAPQTVIKVFRRYNQTATPTQSNVFQPLSSSSMKWVFIRPILKWNGKMRCNKVWPMYMIIAFMPQNTNGAPLHQCCTSTTRKHSVSRKVAIAVVTRTKDNDLKESEE